MPLEPIENIETIDAGQSSVNALEAALLTPSEKPTPVAPPVVTIEEVTPAKVEETTSDEPLDPLDELGKSDEKEGKPSLPIEGKTEELSAEIRAGKTIKAMKEEISTTWKPKVAELEQQIAERESRLEELRAQAEEATALKEKLESMEAEVSVVRLERTPAYIEAVVKPEQEIVDGARKIAEKYGIDTPKLFEAFEAGDEDECQEELDKLIDGLDVSRGDDHKLRSLIQKYLPVKAKKNELYDNADKALAELAARAEQETAAKAAERAVERTKSMDLVAKRITTAAPSLLNFVTEDVVKRAKDTDIDSLDTEKKVYNHLAGLTLPKLEKAYAKLIAERDNLLDEVAAYGKSNPRVGDNAANGAPTTRPRTLEEALLSNVRG